MMKLAFLAVILAVLPSVLNAAGWTYAGASTWASTQPKFCASRRQSPIKLEESISSYDSTLAAYTFTKEAAGTFKLKNDGNTLKLDFSFLEWKTQLTGSTGMCLRPAGIHWHWGSDNTQGSEHWFNNKQYPMEGHIVHWDCTNYNTAADAIAGVNGLAVLGIMYEVDNSAPEDPTLKKVIDQFSVSTIQQCSGCGASPPTYVTTDVTGFDITEFLPTNVADYWSYYGSLTTPPCTENVQWTVFKNTVKITQAQMDAFRGLKFTDASPMVNNYRPPLDLNPTSPAGPKRVLSRSFTIAAIDNPTTVAPQTTTAAGNALSSQWTLVLASIMAALTLLKM